MVRSGVHGRNSFELVEHEREDSAVAGIGTAWRQTETHALGNESRATPGTIRVTLAASICYADDPQLFDAGQSLSRPAINGLPYTEGARVRPERWNRADYSLRGHGSIPRSMIKLQGCAYCAEPNYDQGRIYFTGMPEEPRRQRGDDGLARARRAMSLPHVPMTRKFWSSTPAASSSPPKKSPSIRSWKWPSTRNSAPRKN